MRWATGRRPPSTLASSSILPKTPTASGRKRKRPRPIWRGDDRVVARTPKSAWTPKSRKSRSVVELGRDLAFDPAGVIVLDPELRVVLFHEGFDFLAALRGLLPVGVEVRHLLVGDLFRIMVEIA